MRYLTGVYWCRGRVAQGNQDSVVLLQVLTARGRVLMAAVCDGMSGLAQGETASGYVTERLQEWFYESLLYDVQKKKPLWVIRRSLDRLTFHMQQQLQQYARREEMELGTTMTVLAVWEKTFLVWHLGDSRLYRLYGGHMERVTKDHIRQREQLTKCVGSFGYYTPDHHMGVLRRGEGILLCSDGFRHCVTREELREVFTPGRIREEAQIERRLLEIGEACMKRGEQDNLSAVYIKAER